MPPTRRKQPTTRRAQQTLAFGPTANKVTKPSLPPPNTSKKPPKPPLLEKAALDPRTTPPPTEPPTPQIPESPRTLAIRKQQRGAQQAETGISDSGKSNSNSNSSEEIAKKIPESQIRRYWKGKEEERIAPRVHQQGLSVNEKILRHFDLSSQYGPCIGIARMRRWKRAEGLGLKPPVEVLAVLMREEGVGNRGAERAFMDGLLTSRAAGVE